MPSVNLTNHFLIAMPNMADPHFAKSLTYICDHSPKGAMGLVVSHPLDLDLAGLYKRIDLQLETAGIGKRPVYYGGPVQPECGFVLHRPLGGWHSTLAVDGNIGLTTSRDIMEALGNGAGPDDTLVALGYAGWAAGQLEHEITQNAWLTVEANSTILFDMPPEKRMEAAMHLLGIHASQLSGEAGHA